VTIDKIDEIFDTWESRLGFEYGTEPVINMLRKYYHSTLYFDINGNLQNKYLSLKQGCALAAALSCMVLYELDDFMSKKYDLYYRYSDDCLTIDSNVDEIVDDINNICIKYGTHLNPKKIKPVYGDKWFKFLGFNIKGNMITLSKSRVKSFQKEIEARTIKQRKTSLTKAVNSVNNYLYKGDGQYSWATSVLPIINVDKDIETLNSFVMDSLRACATKRRKIGGLGSVNDRDDYTILRGTGKNVTANRLKTEKEIVGYLTLGCMQNAILTSRPVYEALVRSM
jgi:hypothetical protein